jgi:hypothetical protein
MPVMMAERLGAQTPQIEKQRVKRTPWVASLSTLGLVA